jgi:hypothetical protein
MQITTDRYIFEALKRELEKIKAKTTPSCYGCYVRDLAICMDVVDKVLADNPIPVTDEFAIVEIGEVRATRKGDTYNAEAKATIVKVCDTANEAHSWRGRALGSAMMFMRKVKNE